MKLLIAYIDNANEIEEHNFNKERCSGRTFEPCHPDYKKKQAVSSAAVLVTARIRINLVIGINVGPIMILRPGRRINLLSTERHNGQGFHGSCRANL